MKEIYVILMHTKTIPAKFIKFFTNYKYSHVGISLEKDCNTTYSFGRKKVYSIIDAGFIEEKKDGEFFSKFKDTICKQYEVKVTDEQYENVKNIIEDMKANTDDYKYDFFGIVPRFFGIPVTIKNRYVCSYFVAYVLQKAGICNFDKEICLVRPIDFENLKGFKKIYEGKYIQ